MTTQSQSASPARARPLEEVKAETIRRAGKLNPLDGINPEDGARVANALKSLDRDEWAAEWSKLGERAEADAEKQEKPGGDETPERSRGPRDREGAHHGRQWRPLVTEDGPEQRPVEVPYFAREILQARIAGYCTRLRPGCPSKGSGQENQIVPPRDK